MTMGTCEKAEEGPVLPSDYSATNVDLARQLRKIIVGQTPKGFAMLITAEVRMSIYRGELDRVIALLEANP